MVDIYRKGGGKALRAVEKWEIRPSNERAAQSKRCLSPLTFTLNKPLGYRGADKRNEMRAPLLDSAIFN
jgi:hypothetical protein